MDQPDLVRTALRPRRLARRLLAFLVLGALLLAARWALAPTAAPPPLVVEVAVGADADAIHQAAVEAILIDEAVRARWPLADPVVVERRAELAASASAGAGVDLTRQLAATDPVTRARLAWIGRALVRSRLTPRMPTTRALADYRAAHPARYAPGWLTFHQRTISTARHGAAAAADARALAVQLAGAGVDAPGGDPTLLPARAAGSPAMIDARFGAGFAAQVMAAPPARWSAPVAGAFGFHVVWREPAGPPDGVADEVDVRVARDWAHDDAQAHLRETIAAMVQRRRVVVRQVTR